ncbi:MAG TPA: DUF5701 family protein [Nocardioidaceae bacterium]|nr:DUF5701 family protein [Nocardioidaceae bacterium]
MTHDQEFDRQLQTLLDKDYPALAGMGVHEFTRTIEPLRKLLPHAVATEQDSIPFLIVVRSSLVPTIAAVERIEVRGKAGWSDMADEIDSYKPIDGVDLPLGQAYLVVDVDTGKETLNVRPNDALPMITGAGRTPLTTDEGVALVTQLPEVLTDRNCFQALGSRADNKRIPSFWISKGAPRLGWCWAGNPHTWLGAGSAAARYGAA